MKPKNIEAVYPLSPMQKGMLFHAIYGKEPNIYCQQARYRLTGTLNVSAFRQAWRTVLDRHAALRTVFLWEGLDNPVQAAVKQVKLPFQQMDLRALSAEEKEARLEGLIADERRLNFDLAHAPLMRFCMIQVEDDVHELLWSYHHLLMDGWSLAIVLREVFQFYYASCAQEKIEFTPAREFRDYINWLQEQETASAEEFWRDLLRGFTAPNSFGFPVAREQDTSQLNEQGYTHIMGRLPEADTRRMQQMARQTGVTLNTLCQGAWALLLANYSGQRDVVFGTVVSGRPADLKGVEDMVGLFINTLPVRARINPGATVNEWLQELQLQQIEARQFDYCPLSDIQAWSEVPRGVSLMESILAFENFPLEASGEGPDDLQVKAHSIWGSTNYLINIAVHPGRELVLGAVFDRRRVDDMVVSRMLEHFKTLLRAIATNRSQRLADLQMLTEDESRKIMEHNQTWMEFSRDKCVHEAVEEQARQRPEHTAVICGDERITYSELNRRANQLARYLRLWGAGPEQVVGVCLERSVDLIVALLAILKSGSGYLPMDSGYPEERIRYMTEQSGVQVVVSNDKQREKLKGCNAEIISLGKRRQEIEAESGEDLTAELWPDLPAYLIYTSGSTGQPKGTAVTHGNILRLLRGKWYGHLRNEVVLGYAPISFDASTFEVWAPLCDGGTVALVAEERPSLESLGAFIREEQITTAFLTTALFNAMVDAEIDRLRGLRQIITGGDVMSLRHMQTVISELKGCRLVNAYGPTEGTVITTTYEITPDFAPYIKDNVPIGKPLGNTRTYILDPGFSPVPAEVAGELYIAGEGVARGYWNDPVQTAEKFLPDVCSPYPGQRMYRSGDMVRRREDGNIDFLGRIDNQVKVRGFRVEPGEIENVLVRHKAVKEAAVVVKQEPDMEKRLAAYVTVRGETTTSVEGLRSYLRDKLPDYMVPALIELLPEMPLNASGKVNRQELAARQVVFQQKETVEPLGEVERELSRIWSDVLRIKHVGVGQSFFELGGDSILAIQISARARQAGLHVKPRQIFEEKTIRGLAQAIGKEKQALADQQAVVGEMPLTPIQHWFFEQQFADQHYWNMPMLLRPERPVDFSLLTRAVGEITKHHDGLRLRFTTDEGGHHQRCAAPEMTDAAPCDLVDLQGMSPCDQRRRLEEHAASAQATLDLQRGPLLRVVLYEMGDQQRVLVVVHHLAVDMVSWQVLLEDLWRSYEQLLRGEQVKLGEKSTSYKEWSEKLEQLAQQTGLEQETGYWQRILGGDGAGELPHELQGENTESSAALVEMELTEEETEKLLREVAQQYRASASEVMISTLGRTLREWNGTRAVVVDIEGHGREESVVEGVNLTRTVGWFTVIYPVRLDASAEAPGERVDTINELRRVKEKLREVPRGGLGFGLLKYLSGNQELRQRMRDLPCAQVSFNYLGQLRGSTENQILIGEEHEDPGAAHSLAARRPYVLEVVGLVFNGRLRISWTYSSNVHLRETIEGVASFYMQELRSVLGRCAAAGERHCSPSDFPLASLDQPALDALVKKYPVLEDIYPLSPTQQEMLFHSLAQPESELGVAQLCWTLGTQLDTVLFRNGWQELLHRHEILRTAVMWDRNIEPLQVVQSFVDLPWHEHDWSTEEPANIEARVQEYLALDRKRGFDFSVAPLMRVGLIRRPDETFTFVWTFHHLALDGWSLALILRELWTFCTALMKHEQPELGTKPLFREYIAWFKQQDFHKSESFWRNALGEFNPQATLAADPAAASSSSTYGESQILLRPELTARLDQLARENQITVNSLVAGAWGLLLSRYSGQRDVAFGVTVSGRPAQLPGVENMVGLFINTLPLRLRVRPDAVVMEWLKEVQGCHMDLRQHEHTPRALIHKCANLPPGMPLFDSTFVFENYPFETGKRHESNEGLDFRNDFNFGTRANTPLTLVAAPGEQLGLRIAYDGHRFLAGTIHRMLGHLRSLLDDICANPHECVANLNIGAMAEAKQNSGDRDFDRLFVQLLQAKGSHWLAKELGSNESAHAQIFADIVAHGIPGRHLFVLDGDRQPTPIGVSGELYLGGTDIAWGYEGQPALTAEDFIPDPCSLKAGSRLVSTRTLARWKADMTLEICADDLGDRRLPGHVDVAQIERELSGHPEIAEAAVFSRTDNNQDERVVAYFVAREKSTVAVHQIRAYLRERLSDFMLPSDYVPLPELPRAADGTVALEQLPAAGFAHSFSRVLLVGDLETHDILEFQLARIWEEVFGIRPITPGDNFFALGGDSLTALALVSRIREELSFDLPLAALFEGATIADMAAVLRKQSGGAVWSSLVPIQPHGARPPFFCVHAAGGNVLGFVDLLRYLDKDQPFYGLQSVGLDGSQEPYSRVEDMAAHYLRDIRSVQPHGPYHLGGLSFGGVVAFEMARQLQCQGETVALLALIDTWAPIYEGRLLFKEILPADDFTLFTRYIKGIRQFYEEHPDLKEELSGLRFSQQIDKVLEQLNCSELFGNVSHEHARRVLQIHLHSARAMRDFEPKLHEGKITVFRATAVGPEAQFVIVHPALGKPEIMEGWSQVSTEPLEMIDVPGDHITMIVEPLVATLAERLNECLERAHYGVRVAT